MLLVSQLHGFNAGGKAPLTDISYISSTHGNSATITLPASINAGDGLFIVDVAHSATSTPPSSVTITGFTLSETSFTAVVGSVSHRVNIWHKIADGSEGGGTATGMDGGDADRKTAFLIRGNSPFTTITPGGFIQGTATDGDPADININADAGTPPLVVVGVGVTHGGNDADANLSPAAEVDLRHSTGTRMTVLLTTYDSSPADALVQMADVGSANHLFGLYYTFT